MIEMIDTDTVIHRDKKLLFPCLCISLIGLPRKFLNMLTLLVDSYLAPPS